MKRLLLLGLLLVLGFLEGQARQQDLQGPIGHSRALRQTAVAGAQGTQSASSAAFASNINGQQMAATSSNAAGPTATTYGLSAAAGQINTCLNGPMFNESQCRTYAPQIRSVNCTDIAPDARFTCDQQVNQYKKCGADFMFLGAFCLRSCNRCGSSCVDDKPSDGSACDVNQCDSSAYKSAPVCLKTCGRCSPVSV